MGYFNYFIKCIIKNVSYHICKPRNVIIIICIIFFVLRFASFSFAVEEVISNPTDQSNPQEPNNSKAFQYDNQFNHLYTMQNSLQERFIANLYANKDNNGFQNLVSAIFNETKNFGLSDKVLYVTYGTGNTEFVIYYTYSHILSVSVSDTYVYDLDNYCYKNLPVSGGTFTQIGSISVQNNLASANVHFQDLNMSVPYACLNVFNEKFIDLFKYYGLIDNDTISELQALTSRAEQTNNSLNNINSTMQQQNQLQQAQNNFLQNSDVNVGAGDLPNNSTTDITSSGFDNIFNLLYNTFTSSASTDLVLPLPFVNKSITINYDNVFGSFNGGFLFTLVNAFWYYVVSVYIVKDIYRKIYSIKSGNIENVENTNIKEDLL